MIFWFIIENHFFLRSVYHCSHLSKTEMSAGFSNRLERSAASKTVQRVESTNDNKLFAARKNNKINTITKYFCADSNASHINNPVKTNQVFLPMNGAVGVQRFGATEGVKNFQPDIFPKADSGRLPRKENRNRRAGKCARKRSKSLPSFNNAIASFKTDAVNPFYGWGKHLKLDTVVRNGRTKGHNTFWPNLKYNKKLAKLADGCQKNVWVNYKPSDVQRIERVANHHETIKEVNKPSAMDKLFKELAELYIKKILNAVKCYKKTQSELHTLVNNPSSWETSNPRYQLDFEKCLDGNKDLKLIERGMPLKKPKSTWVDVHLISESIMMELPKIYSRQLMARQVIFNGFYKKTKKSTRKNIFTRPVPKPLQRSVKQLLFDLFF